MAEKAPNLQVGKYVPIFIKYGVKDNFLKVRQCFLYKYNAGLT